MKCLFIIIIIISKPIFKTRSSAAAEILHDALCHVKSGLGVVQGHWKWYRCYKFLLAFYTTLYVLRYNYTITAISVISKFFNTPLLFNAPPRWVGSSKDICSMFDVCKLESLGYSPPVWQTDRQTDRHHITYIPDYAHVSTIKLSLILKRFQTDDTNGGTTLIACLTV